MRKKSELNAVAEMALMGIVVPCEDDEAQYIAEYIAKVVNLPFDVTDICVQINKHNPEGKENHIKYISVNKIEDMPIISFLLQIDVDENDEWYYPRPLTFEDGEDISYTFCYCYNLKVDYFSEFGDCCFTKDSNGFFHRVA